MTRFIHTSDWQLGMTRAWLSPEAQARFSQARIDAIDRIGETARKERAEFIAVAGDVFDANWIEPRTVARSLDALAKTELPVFLLPGNHDPYDASSIFKQPGFAARKPKNVTVLSEPGMVSFGPKTEILAAPWTSKRPISNPVAPLLGSLGRARGTRILLAHGGIDSLSPDPGNPLLLRQKELENAIEGGALQYVAMGDRHSTLSIGSTGRIRYSGAPEPTAYVEEVQRKALVVDVDQNDCQVADVEVGTWRFLREARVFSGDDDLGPLREWLNALPGKATTTLKLGLRGTLSLRGRAALDEILDSARTVFGGLEVWDREDHVMVSPADTDLQSLGLTGFAKQALDELREMSTAGGEGATIADDALALLWRLGSEGGAG